MPRPTLRESLFHALDRRFFYGWAILGVAGLGIFASGPGQSHTFVMTGLHDRVFRVEKDVAELAARIAKRREIVFSDAGHLIPLERPEKFGKALLEFAATL